MNKVTHNSQRGTGLKGWPLIYFVVTSHFEVQSRFRNAYGVSDERVAKAIRHKGSLKNDHMPVIAVFSGVQCNALSIVKMKGVGITTQCAV